MISSPSLLSTLVFGLLLSAAEGLFGGPMAAEARMAEDLMKVDFDALINIDYKEGEALPATATKYDGKKVSVKGFMENSTPEGTSTFMLVTDGCGCNGELKVHHFIEVDLGYDTIGYLPDLLTVTGTFEVGEVKEDGYVVSVYRLKADSVN